MIYDDLNKKWVPSGTSHGLSKVHIYHHFINNTFRVVGRKLQDHEVSKFQSFHLIVFRNHKKCLIKYFNNFKMKLNLKKKFKKKKSNCCKMRLFSNTVYDCMCMCIFSWDLLTPFNDRLFRTLYYLQSYKSCKKTM